MIWEYKGIGEYLARVEKGSEFLRRHEFAQVVVEGVDEAQYKSKFCSVTGGEGIRRTVLGLYQI